MLRLLSTIVVPSVLLLTGCVRLNADHCGNQDGDATCAERGGASMYCNVCVSENDGCVADAPSPECGFGAGSASVSSAGPSTSTASSSASGETTTVEASTTNEMTSGGASSSSGEPMSFCGDGTVDPDEQCDGEGTTCGELDAGVGMAPCTADCLYDLAGCSKAPECGDGEVDNPEVCEPGVPNPLDCEDVFSGYIGGDLGCTANCTYDTSQCIPCDGANTPCDSATCCDGLSCQPAIPPLRVLGNTCRPR